METAVNLEAGKTYGALSNNLSSSFRDPATLNTLPDMEWINGRRNYQIRLFDVPGLLTQLEHKPLIKHRDSISTVIARCVQAKADIGNKTNASLAFVPP